MTKTRIKTISRRSLSTILAVLMLFSTLMVGTMITANAWGVQGGHKVYFVNTGAWSNVYHHFWGSNWNNWETMTQVANTGIYYKNYANDYTADGFNFMSSKSQSGGTSGRTDWVTSNVAYSGDNSMNYQTDLTKLNGTAKVVSMVSDGGSYTQSANANCVATISSKNLASGYTSTSNTSGSTGSSSSAVCYPAYGASVSYSASDSDEYVFMGFSTTNSTSLPNDATTSFSNRTSIGFNGGNNLSDVYAYFKKRTTSVTLNQQGGSGGTASVTATYGSDMPSATMPSKTGYTFAGYYDTSATSGGNMYYKANGSSNKTWDKTDATYTLYARWTQNNYSISSANASGTTSTMYNFTGTSTAHYQESPTFTLSPATGYKIDSITVKDASNNNVAYTKSSNTYTITSMPASNVTVTVSASIKTYTITLSETSATGGSLKVDNATFTSGSTVTHGSHTFRVDAPSGWEISSISSTGASWTNNESYAESGTVNITGNYSISVTYVRSSNPALNVRYIDASGSTVNASTGPITAGSAHYLEVTFTNQNTFTVGTSYSWNYTKNGTQQASGSGSTANSSSAITLKSWGAITAGTYVFTVTAGTKTKSITVNVNQSRKLTVSSVDHTTVSGSYTSEFGESKSITAAGEYWCNDGTSYTVTYTADSDYCFSSSSNNTTTSTDSGTISADHTATTPTVYEKKFTLTKVKYSTQVNGNTSSSSSNATMNTVTGTDVASGSVAGHYVTSWQVTSGTVIVNGTSYTSSSGAQAITGNNTKYTLSSVTLKGDAKVRFYYTEIAYTLTMKKKVGSASTASIGTQSGYYVTTSTVTAPAITGYKVSSWQITTANTYFYIGSTGYNSSSGVQDITDVDTYTISNVNLRGNATIRFNYVENIYAVTVASATQGTKALGTVSPSSVNAGIDTNLSITATAKDGYEFTNWTGTNVTFANANSASTTVSATADGTATANFRQTKLYLDISANSTWKGGSTISIYFFSNDSAYTSDSNYSTGYVTMEAVDGVENLYVGDIPSGFYDNKAGKWGFIFRYGNWTKQTADLQFDGNKNKYTLQNTETSGKTNYTLDNDAYFPPRAHTVSVGTITTSPHNGTSPGYTGDGGAVTVNNASSARISEHTNYAIKVSPTAGYKLTALAVNGTSIISGHENATSEFTINHAMGTGGESYAETITATFTAISYSISVSDNSSGNGGTIKYKKNGGTATATAGTATVEDRIQPVVTVNRTSGYKLTTVQLKNGSNVTQAILTNNGTEFSPSYSVYGMKAYNSKLEANFAAIQPAMASISTTTQGVSISGYTVNAYAGQTITITPAVTSTSYGVISYEGGSMNMVSGVDNATKTQSGNTFTVTIPKNIGPNASSTAQYTFTITPKNSPAGVTAVTGAPQTITINVSYSGTPATNGAQQAYMNLKTMYDTYTEYGITDNDVVSGFTAFENARTAAGNTLGNFPTNLPAWNASAANYTSALSNLTTKYGELVFKTNTIYVLSQYSSDVKLHTYNRSGFFDTEATQVTGATQGDGKGFAMTLEGTTNSGKYLYSMTYQGKCDFTVYKVSGSTTVGTSNRISNNITLATTTNSSNIAYNTTTGKYVYGNYYLDLKDKSTGSTTFTIENVTEFADFGNSCISATGATGDNDLVGQCEEGDTGYSVSTIISKLGISYSGASLVTSSQAVNTSFAITGPARGESSTVTVDGSHNWVPTKPGRYTVVVNASLGTDSRASAGATFTGTKSTIDNTNTVLSLFVAYDDIEVFADMNGNVGTPTIHFTYTDNQGNDADLPYEFDMVTGSESVYSYTISVSTLKDMYHIDLINGAHTEGGITYRAAEVSEISIDSVTITGSGFTISRAAARTGTLWLKADSTNMKTFNAIAYGSSTRTFKAVLRNGNTNTDFNNSFAEVNGTGIITDELVGDSYQYSSFYAAKDTTADYDFSYTLRAKAQTDITHKDGNTTNYYYFDHWERINGNTTTTTGLTEANGADINILKAPVYSTNDSNITPDPDVTYVAVYKPVTQDSTSARCEITYHFKDFDTSDGNYEYDPDKTLTDETYTKTVPLGKGALSLYTAVNNNTDATAIAGLVVPKITSNYFDYPYRNAVYKSHDTETNKYKIDAYFWNQDDYDDDPEHNPDCRHEYKIVVISSNGTTQTVQRGYYQQPLELKASDYGITNNSNYHWSVYDGSAYRTAVSYNSSATNYINPSNTSFTVRFTNTNGISDNKVQRIRLYTGTETVDPRSTISYGYSITYYDNDTEKAQHNFYIVDIFNTSHGEFVGGGVVYATTDGTDYRQNSARTHLASDNSRKAYINGILDGNYDKEYKAQTIDNVGFRYLPYSKGTNVFRYSDGMGAYIHTFAGTNTNSSSLEDQTLRMFSFFVYEDTNNQYQTVVSSTYAEVSRYVAHQSS